MIASPIPWLSRPAALVLALCWSALSTQPHWCHAAETDGPSASPAAGQTEAEKSESAFLRFVKTGPIEGHLDTALKRYVRETDQVVVDLLAVVHVGDAGYYDHLQRRFEAYDALLYEMIREGGAEAETEPGTDHPVSQLQIGMKTLLELEFQLDRIDYQRTNFVHADLDPDSFAKLQAERGESILGLLFKAALEEQRRLAADPSSAVNPFSLLFALTSKDRGQQLKFLLGRQMSQMEDLLAGLDASADGQGSALLSGRNQHAMKVLAEQIAKGRRKLAIFYGAGHMADFEKRLLAQGFVQKEEEWLVAWDIRGKKKIEGWTVHVSPQLLKDDAAATARALELMRNQLVSIREKLPAGAVARLQKVPLWLNPVRPGDTPRAEYHPDARWLRDHGRDPAMAQAIEFTNIPTFAEEEKRMPVFILHELAHAYHDLVLGFDHPEIRAAFEAARKGGRYESVRRWTGERETRDRAYALTNHKEYFAENTEAFFGRNDFEPFTREELHLFDPEMDRLLARLWGLPESP